MVEHWSSKPWFRVRSPGGPLDKVPILGKQQLNQTDMKKFMSFDGGESGGGTPEGGQQGPAPENTTTNEPTNPPAESPAAEEEKQA